MRRAPCYAVGFIPFSHGPHSNLPRRPTTPHLPVMQWASGRFSHSSHSNLPRRPTISYRHVMQWASDRFPNSSHSNLPRRPTISHRPAMQWASDRFPHGPHSDLPRRPTAPRPLSCSRLQTVFFRSSYDIFHRNPPRRRTGRRRHKCKQKPKIKIRNQKGNKPKRKGQYA